MIKDKGGDIKMFDCNYLLEKSNPKKKMTKNLSMQMLPKINERISFNKIPTLKLSSNKKLGLRENLI
jgi:hypothetical protein